MKDWVFGRRYCEEQQGNEGDQGGAGGAGDQGGAGGAGDQGGGEQQAHDNKEGEDDGAGAGEEEHNNALGEELNKPDAGGTPAPPGKEGDKPKDPPPDPNAPTEEEVKAYKDALKLDEEVFGKGVKFDDRYMGKLPGLFKKHGLDPAKANALANDFAKLQKEVETDTAAKIAKFREWRQGEMKKMNDAYLKEYDQAGRGDIARAITHFFPKGSAMFEAVCRTEVGVDPGFLMAMKFIGERLPKDAAPGATAGAGATGAKSISDSFMGL